VVHAGHNVKFTIDMNVFFCICSYCSDVLVSDAVGGPHTIHALLRPQSPSHGSHSAQLFCTAQLVTNRCTNGPCDICSSRLDFAVQSCSIINTDVHVNELVFETQMYKFHYFAAVC